MMDGIIADVLVMLTALVAVPGFLLFVAALFVEAADAMDAMERNGAGSRMPPWECGGNGRRAGGDVGERERRKDVQS